MNDLKPIKSPKPVEDKKLRKIPCDETTYRRAIGNRLYLAICTRPDLLFSVSKASRRSKNPNMEDWENIIKIFRYLKGTINYGILFTKESKLNISTWMLTTQVTRRLEDPPQVSSSPLETLRRVGHLNYNTAYPPPQLKPNTTA